MQPIQITAFNNVLKAPNNWDEEKLGPCVDLHIRAMCDQHGVVRLVSAWMPSRADIFKMQNGCPVLLTLLAKQHPPVWVEVGSRKDVPKKIIKPRSVILDAEGKIIKGNGTE